MSAKTTKLTSYEEIRQVAMETYRHSFGTEPEVACCAPGRVNLIGEHVDYNDGFVLPMALSMVTLFVGGQRSDDEADVITCCSGVDEPRRVRFSLNLQHLQRGTPKWANYIKGVLHGFGQPVKGFNAVIVSNVPVGAGLSSSAALEVATLTFLEHFTGVQVASTMVLGCARTGLYILLSLLFSDAERALICQAAEHKFVGMPCGIMDQMISVAARSDHAILLDCRSLETFQIPFVAAEEDLVVLICNSDVRHELSNSEYPARRQQCAQALEIMELESYRDATEGCLSALEHCDEVLMRRARHVITEIKRTREAATALHAHDFKKMGELMTKSHVSLRDDFQVSCPELDVLVDAAINCSGVLGSRMTGGGFGGCTVTLLQRGVVDEVISTMRMSFIRKFNKTAGDRIEFYTCTPGTGARRVH